MELLQDFSARLFSLYISDMLCIEIWRAIAIIDRFCRQTWRSPTRYLCAWYAHAYAETLPIQVTQLDTNLLFL